MFAAIDRKNTISATHASPRLNVPFLDAFNVQHGPAGVLGRFFLTVDHRLKQQGIALEFASFAEVSEVQRRNVANWSFMNPMFDPAMSDIPADGALCIVGRDASGRIVGTGSGKRFDASTRTFTDIVDSGDFFAIRPADNPTGLATRIRAPIADRMRGTLGYCGGIWVHPDHRGQRLPAVFGRLVNACMVTLWNAEFVLGFVRSELKDSGYHTRYGFKHDEPSLVITQNDTTLIEAILLWMTADETAGDIALFLEGLWSEIDATVVAGRRQNSA